MVRGEAPSPSLEELHLELRQAHAAIEAGRKDREALGDEERAIEQEIEAVEDANPAHFLAQAEAKSAATEEKRAALAQETAAVVTTGREAQRQWSRYRNSCRRRGAPVPREVLISDLGGVSSELAKSQGDSYPGSSLRAWEQWCAREAAERNGAKMTNAEALVQFAGKQG
jgi:predicted alpha/beta hydrolase